MIEHLLVSETAQLWEVRRRIKAAAELVGADNVQAAMLAANVSDMLRRTLAGDTRDPGQPIAAVVEVRHPDSKPELVVSLECQHMPATAVGRLSATAGSHRRLGTKGLSEVREILTRKTREELIDETHAQNARLLEREQLLQKALQEAKSATEAKSAFLANMSHELRTPMNSILGFTKRLLKRLDGQIGERDLDALTTVDRNGRHLLGLINDILDLSKIEAGRMELAIEPCSLDTLIHEVVRQCEPLLSAGEQTITTSLARELDISVDTTKVRQILTNLVSNAIKYSERGAIEVSAMAEYDPELGPVAIVGVRDPGDGLTPEQCDSLFQPFVRLDTAATKTTGGTGLGLIISAQYAEMHGGRIDIHSVPGVGSTFFLVLPMTHTQSVAPSEESGRRSLSLLLVEDDEVFVAAARDYFADSQVDILTASSQEALERQLQDNTPDFVCLAEKFRHLEDSLPDVPLVTLSDDLFPRTQTATATLSQLQETIVRTLGKRLTKVLIVEDNPDARELVHDVFSATGAELVTATTGDEALAILADDPPPSAIILDLMLPGLSGFDVLAELRKDPRLEAIPTVILSAMSLTSDQLVRLERMAFAILEKGEGAPERAVAAALAAVRDTEVPA